MDGNPTESEIQSVSDSNPYAVSQAEPQQRPTDKPKLLQLFFDTIWAVIVIVGVIFAWILLGGAMIGSGGVFQVVLGLSIFVVLCAIEARRWAARRSQRENAD